MVVVRAVFVSLIWSFLAFISLFPNSLLLIWLMFCDKVPFSTFLCYLTNTWVLVGSLAGCHLKLLYPVFIPLKIAIMEVWGSLPALRESSITTSFGWMGYLSEASWIPWYLQSGKRIWMYLVSCGSTKTFGCSLQLRLHQLAYASPVMDGDIQWSTFTFCTQSIQITIVRSELNW